MLKDKSILLNYRYHSFCVLQWDGIVRSVLEFLRLLCHLPKVIKSHLPVTSGCFSCTRQASLSLTTLCRAPGIWSREKKIIYRTKLRIIHEHPPPKKTKPQLEEQELCSFTFVFNPFIFSHIGFLCNIYCFTAPQANLRDTFPFTSVSAVWPLVVEEMAIIKKLYTSQKGPVQTHFKLLDKPQIYLAEVTKENILDKVTDYIKDGQLQ